ncbi:MAG TPA: DNA-binding protein [Oculatellaceae cyanobacterium]
MASSFGVRRPIIDRDEFWSVADRLAAEGKEITALSMLSALGGGSFTTIYRYLGDWLASQPKATADNKGEIPDVVQNAFASAWRVAALEAAREIAAAKDKAAAEVQAAQKQFQEAIQAIERLESDAETDTARIADLEKKVQDLEAALQKMGNENAALGATAEQLRHQVKSQDIELARVHKESESSRHEHQQEIERLNNKQAAAQDKANSEIQSLRERLSDNQKQLEQVNRKLQEVETQISGAEARATKAEEKAAQSDKDRELAITEAATLKGQATTLKSQNDELLSRLTDRDKKEKR